VADIILLAKIRSIFSAAANRVNLVSGEDLEVSLGKISKWLSDLKTVAFTGSYNDLTDKPTIPSSAVTGVKGSSESNYRTGDVNITKSNIGLGNVENKSSATIRSEITSSNVTSALGYTPVNKAGDSMTGSLRFPDSTGIWGVDSYYSQGINFVDDDNYGYMVIGSLQNTEGRLTFKYDKIEYDGHELATLNDIPSAAVTGVKGNTETNYRTGNVNITAANIGAVRYDTSSQGLTSTQKSNARTNLGLGSAATYSSSSFATSTQGGYATDFNSNFKPIFTTSGQSHASVFRGKYLGSSFTSAQKAAIADGSFDDLYVGDYWTINGINWRIADVDYFLKSGRESSPCNTHHLVIVPDTQLGTSYMNSSNTSSGGYAGSYMFKTTLKQDGTESSTSIYGKIKSAFGSSYILAIDNYLCNAIGSNGNPSGFVLTSIKCSLLTQAMVLGWMLQSVAPNTNNLNTGICGRQLALFRLAPSYICTSGWFWFADILGSTAFARISSEGVVYFGNASTTQNVRPYFCLKGA
jgi:hypothetical protein